MAEKHDDVDILERGNLYFFYRPRVYATALPRRPGEVQEELNIEDEASYILAIKNPEKPSPPGAGLGEHQAEYPKRLMETFRGRRFVDADPPEFLDYEGTEFILISAAGDVEQELGIELDGKKESSSRAEIFHDLRLKKSNQPTEPLFQGEWK